MHYFETPKKLGLRLATAREWSGNGEEKPLNLLMDVTKEHSPNHFDEFRHTNTSNEGYCNI